jgi:hypothetical protein
MNSMFSVLKILQILSINLSVDVLSKALPAAMCSLKRFHYVTGNAENSPMFRQGFSEVL